MRLIARSAFFAALVMAAPTLAAQAAPGSSLPPVEASHAAALSLGRATVRFALTNQVDSLVATVDPAAAPSGLRESLTEGLAQIAVQLGAERKVVTERVLRINGQIEYQRTAEFEMVPVPLVFRVILGPQNTWRGFTANTVENTPDGEEIKPDAARR